MIFFRSIRHYLTPDMWPNQLGSKRHSRSALGWWFAAMMLPSQIAVGVRGTTRGDRWGGFVARTRYETIVRPAELSLLSSSRLEHLHCRLFGRCDERWRTSPYLGGRPGASDLNWQADSRVTNEASDLDLIIRAPQRISRGMARSLLDDTRTGDSSRRACGNAAVRLRARGVCLRVLASDPFALPRRAKALGGSLERAFLQVRIMSVAFLFPGQGSQFPGMLHQLLDHPEVHRTLDEISAALHSDVRTSRLPKRSLESSVSVQIALLAAGVATARALIEKAPARR